MELSMSREYAKVIAKAWIDPSFKARLMQEPAAVLSEYGITLPEGTDFSNLLSSVLVNPIDEPKMYRDMNLEIHTCPDPDRPHFGAVTACPSPEPMDLVHEQHLAIANCPAE